MLAPVVSSACSNFFSLLQDGDDDAGSLGSGENLSDADSLPDDADGLEGSSAHCYADFLWVIWACMTTNIDI